MRPGVQVVTLIQVQGDFHLFLYSVAHGDEQCEAKPDCYSKFMLALQRIQFQFQFVYSQPIRIEAIRAGP